MKVVYVKCGMSMRPYKLVKELYLRQMSSHNDALVIGIILTLIFSAVIYYIYTLHQQLEGKVGNLHTIIFDLKKANDTSMMMFDQQMNGGSMFVPEPFNHEIPSRRASSDSFHIPEPVADEIQYVEPVADKVDIVQELINSIETKETTPIMEVNYESMTYKELQGEAKRKHIKGASKMTKVELIDSLKNHDNGTEIDGFHTTNIFEGFQQQQHDGGSNEFNVRLDSIEEVTL